ncbi:MAG: heterocyst formation ABC transporter subunit HepA [Cyanobacteria bacterium P01_C01_bin.72]
MNLKILSPIRRLLRASQFWQDNGLLLKEFTHFKRIALLSVIFTITAAVFEGFGVGFLLSFLQSLTQPDSEAVKTGFDLVDVWILGSNQPANERVYRISLFILLTTLIRTTFSYLGRVYSGYAQAELTYQLRLKVFEQLQGVAQSFFTKTRSGGLINTVTTEISQLKQVMDISSTLASKLSVLVTYIVSMLLLSWQLSIVSISLFVLMFVGVSTLIKRVREISFKITKANSAYTSVALELINGIKTVHASVAENFERQRAKSSSSNLRKVERQATTFRYSIEPITESASTTILITMLLYAFVFLIPTGELTIASLLTFLFLLFRLIPIVRLVNSSRSRLSNFQGSIGSIRELLRQDDKPYLANGTQEFFRLNRGIELRSVDFGYEPNNLVLHDVTLNIERGKMTALVGGSGAGKTTIADLITRFYDPTWGNIYFDGVNLKDLELKSLRRRMAIVSQDTFIFNASVRDNIAYGLDNVKESNILRAAQLANADEFIRNLPQKFDTKLGDRGTRLSGGQRQRIAIARAILREPEILILDEATSALDSLTERLIQESLATLSSNRTVIAIAHRLSTIAEADKVVVLDQGKITEQGSYQELLDRRGELWKYHQMQYQSN